MLGSARCTFQPGHKGKFRDFDTHRTSQRSGPPQCFLKDRTPTTVREVLTPHHVDHDSRKITRHCPHPRRGYSYEPQAGDHRNIQRPLHPMLVWSRETWAGFKGTSLTDPGSLQAFAHLTWSAPSNSPRLSEKSLRQFSGSDIPVLGSVCEAPSGVSSAIPRHPSMIISANQSLAEKPVLKSTETGWKKQAGWKALALRLVVTPLIAYYHVDRISGGKGPQRDPGQ